MSPYKRSFLELAVDANALKFSEFTLKSGRVSPYFFNALLFSVDFNYKFSVDVIVIPLLSMVLRLMDCLVLLTKEYRLQARVAVAFADQGMDYPVSFNRKELKDHGEGGGPAWCPLRWAGFGN